VKAVVVRVVMTAVVKDREELRTMSDTLKLPRVTKFPPMPVCKLPRIEDDKKFLRRLKKQLYKAVGIPKEFLGKNKEDR